MLYTNTPLQAQELVLGGCSQASPDFLQPTEETSATAGGTPNRQHQPRNDQKSTPKAAWTDLKNYLY